MFEYVVTHSGRLMQSIKGYGSPLTHYRFLGTL